MKFSLFTIVTLFTAALFGNHNQVNYEFSFPKLEKTRTSSNEIKLSMPGFLNTMEAGLPSIPVKTLKIAVPAGFKYESADWITAPGKRESLDAKIALSSSQVPISWLDNMPKNLPRTAKPEMRGATFPEQPMDISIQKLHGIDILIINLYPVEVSRDLNSYLLTEEGKLEIHYTEAARGEKNLFQHQLEEVANFVDNPEVVATYSRGNEPKAIYDYLIISTKDYISYTGPDNLADFQNSLKERGLTSQVIDLATINARVDGDDTADKIRNYVKQEHGRAGIRYLLLAGEGREKQPNFIPNRKLYSKVNAYFGGITGWIPVELDIPADSFFGCLDGVFNNNGNEHWGEANDGPNGGDVDFLAEVSVGRVLLRSTADLQNFVKKTKYVGANGLTKNTFLLGEMLFQEKNLYGDEYMEQLLGSVEEHGFKTNGYNGDWATTKFYDRPGEWKGADAQAKINASDFGMVNHLGHSNNSINMRISTSNVASFSNAKPFFYYSQGCYAGGYNTGSIIDRMVVATNAAVAAVGNSVYGLAPEDPQPELTKTPGASQMIHRTFIHNLLSGSKVALGRAHAASKEFFIGLKSAQEVRWVNWTATYFGDPSLTLK